MTPRTTTPSATGGGAYASASTNEPLLGKSVLGDPLGRKVICRRHELGPAAHPLDVRSSLDWLVFLAALRLATRRTKLRTPRRRGGDAPQQQPPPVLSPPRPPSAVKDERTLRDACFDFERQLLTEARPERVVTAVAWRLENLVCVLIGHVKLADVDDELLRGFATVLRRQELKAEADYTLQHLAWVLVAAGRDIEQVEFALGLREEPF